MRAELITTLLALVPLVAAFASLLAGRYPGERLLGAPRPRARSRAPGRIGAARRPASTLAPGAAVLMSCGLAGRAPPCRAALR